jgi:hypothetical protein
VSVKAIAWAFEQNLKGNHKLVLIALANFADEHGGCWPSHRSIASHAGCSISTAQRCIKELEKRGYLVAREQTSESGRKIPCRYDLLLTAVVFKIEPEPQHLERVSVKMTDRGIGQNDRQPGQNDRGVSVTGDRGYRSSVTDTKEPSLEPSSEEPPNPQTGEAAIAAKPNSGTRKPKSAKPKAEIDCVEAFRTFADAAQRLGLPIPNSLTPSRRRSIAARIREHGPESWGKAMAMIEASPLLLGQVPDKDFRISLDWLLKPANFPKVLDGNYVKRDAKSATTNVDLWWHDPAKVAAVTPSQWRGSIAKHAAKIWPIDKLGPPPGDRGCLVPRAIIDELELSDRYDEHGIATPPRRSRSRLNEAHA